MVDFTMRNDHCNSGKSCGQASMKKSTDALQAGREFAIAGVISATGLTKDQIAQKQLEIENMGNHLHFSP